MTRYAMESFVFGMRRHLLEKMYLFLGNLAEIAWVG